jgi:hypothetical protein
VQYSGTPIVDFRVDRPADDYIDGTVTLTKIRVHACGGGYTDVTVGQTIDPVAVQSVQIPAGDHCQLTFYWSTSLDIDGPTYTVRYSSSTTAVPLSADIEPVYLSPWSVVSGSMSGGGPWLLVDIR